MTVDLHGLRLEELAKELDQHMHRAMTTGEEMIEFITGTGVLQDTLISRCREIYNCEVRIKLGNTGALIVTL